MDLRRSKRLKARSKLSSDEDADQHQGSQKSVNSRSEEPSKADPVATVFSTPEIIERIFANLYLHDRKHCRSVCKVWNQEVCRGFRQSGVTVSIQDTYDDRTGKRSLSNLLAAVEAGKELQLPSPFSKELAVALHLKYIDSALDKIKALPFSVIALKFLIDGSDKTMDIQTMQAKAVHAIPLIQHCAPTLTHLTTPAWESERSSIELNLPELKRLTVLFKVFYSGEELAELVHTQGNFFLQCLDGAPKLEEFCIDGESSTSEDMDPWRNYPSSYISNFLSVVDLSLIQMLSVDFNLGFSAYDISGVEDTLEGLKSVDIPQLKRLCISTGYSRRRTIPLVLEVIDEFSESLQEFSTDLDVLESCKFPYCPYLTRLVFGSEVIFKYLDLTNLPSLKSIVLEGDIKRENYFRGPPVPTVEVVGIYSHWSWHDDGDPQPWQLNKYFNTLFEWFPNASTWEVNDRLLESELPAYVKRKRIENLKIREPEPEDMEFKRTLTDF